MTGEDFEKQLAASIVGAAERVFEKYRELWRVEADANARTVATCAASKTPPGDHYWEKEHQARLRMNVAREVYIACQETLNG